jgi:hypothetical protein
MAENNKNATPTSSFVYFLTEQPPGKWQVVSSFAKRSGRSSGGTQIMCLPVLELHCAHKTCTDKGLLNFSSMDDSDWISESRINNNFLRYSCQNCEATVKTFALRSEYDKDKNQWAVYKLGEDPSFGPPIPARAIPHFSGI